MIIDRRIVARAWSIAWPLIVAEAVDSILSITDTFFVSRLGDKAVAAVGFGGYASWVFFVFTQLFYMGSLVIVAQAFGAKLLDKASRAMGESITSSIFFSLIPVGIVLVIAEDLVSIVAGGGVGLDVLVDSANYLRVRVLGLPVLSTAMVISAGFRAIGDTKPSMIATIVGAVVNIILDPIMIFGLIGFPAMGVVGAAWASFIASIATLTSYIAYSRRLPFTIKPLLPGREAWNAFKLGLPAMVERLVFSMGGLAYIGAITRCGEVPLAAHTIGIRFESFAYLPAFAISIATASIVGQTIGRGDFNEAMRMGWELAKANALFMTAMAVILIVAAPYAPLVFTSNELTRELAMIYLILAAISEPALGVVMSIANAIRGGGNTIVPTIVNACSLYGVRVLLAYRLTSIVPARLCPIGAWIAMDLDLFIRALVFTIVYKKWFHKLARRVV